MKTLNVSDPQGCSDKSKDHTENMYIPFCVISHYHNEVSFPPTYPFENKRKHLHICKVQKKDVFSRSP